MSMSCWGSRSSAGLSMSAKSSDLESCICAVFSLPSRGGEFGPCTQIGRLLKYARGYLGKQVCYRICPAKGLELYCLADAFRAGVLMIFRRVCAHTTSPLASRKGNFVIDTKYHDVRCNQYARTASAGIPHKEYAGLYEPLLQNITPIVALK